METLIASTTVSEDGQLTVPAPAGLNGQAVQVEYKVTPRQSYAKGKRKLPANFWDKVYGSITDPAFKRYPQPPPDPPPSFE